MYCNVCKYRKFKKTKISYILKKTLSLSVVYSVIMNLKNKYLMKKNQLKY